MKKIIYIILISVLVSCSEIIEPSLEKVKINILTPTDTLSSQYSQTFYWEKVENATKYQLQIASPSFDKAQKIVLDTITKSNTFTITFNPARYQIRIRAYNNSSNSDWTYKNIKIDSADLSTQMIVLNSPVNEFESNASSYQLKWQSVFGASKYKVQIDTLSSFESAFKMNKTSVSNFYNLNNLPKEGTYYWRVKAINSIDSTEWSEAYYFVLDKTAPASIVSGSPNDQTLITYSRDSIITWTPSPDKNVTYTVKIQYGSSAAFQSLGNTTNTFMKYTTNAAQKISWRVLVTDKAGNASPESNATTFSFNTR
jgi:hypothetical protein